MGYYEDKVHRMHKHEPTAGAVADDWIRDLQNELKIAGRQIDKLDRKLRIRSRKLGIARAGQVNYEYGGQHPSVSELLNGIPVGFDFADPNGPELRAMEFQLDEAHREIEYLLRDERD